MTTHSIRRALLIRLMGPLLLVAVVAGACAYSFARHFSEVVLDQWLHDSAISLASRVRWEGDNATVDLPDDIRKILEIDRIDRVFYEVASNDGKRIGGNAFLPPPPVPLTKPGATSLYEGSASGARVRVLALALPEHQGKSVIVKVAETQQKRIALAQQVLWISLGLSLVLAGLSAVFIWDGIGRGIASMELAVRNARHLDAAAPLTPIPVGPDMPVEVFPLVKQINQLLASLAVANRVNERFIFNAAHQLRTPVATLRVRLEMAIRERDPSRRTQAIDDAVQVVAYMGRMLHQLLILAKADEKSVEPAKSFSADLGLLARTEVERRLDDAVALGVDLGYDGPGTTVIVAGKGDLIREAIANLLDNALRYGTAGGQITVGVVAGPDPELYVEDRGPGIDVAERERVTERFYRVPGTPGDGCGLGLAIVDEIATLAGARFTLESRADGPGLRARLVFGQGTLSSAKPAAVGAMAG